MSEPFFTVRLDDDGVRMLDQRLLPGREEYLLLRRAEEVAEAIEAMAVRGAPAIGVAAAMGVAVELCAKPDAEPGRVLEAACTRLAATRPTAVNLHWALAKIRERIEGLIASGASGESICREARDFARALHDQDIEVCRAIGEQGRSLVPDRARLLTHCNAGGLATAGYGTALGVVRSAAREGKIARVLASETRPFLQGARLTTWELQRDGIPVTLITDSMAGSLMRAAEIDVVVVGADRIAANGDVANKIGTYPLAVLAQAHGIPFYVAAPLSTIDLETSGGDAIPIEQRSPEEVTRFAGQPIVAPGVTALHPAFDVTPAEHVTAIITESGVIEAPFTDSLARHKSA